MWRLIETIAGGAAPAAASYQYLTTDGETVAETAFVDGAVNVPDDAIAVQITFNVAIRPDQLNSSKFLLMLQSNGIVSSTYKAGTTAGTPDYKKVIVTPVAGLAASTDYSLVVAPGVKSTTGKLSAGETVQFSTTA